MDKNYDFLIDQYDFIDQTEIYKIVDLNREKLRQSWIERFRKDTVSSDDKYLSEYYDLKKMSKDPKFKSSAPELKSWVYRFVNDYPDLLNLKDIEKYAIKKDEVNNIKNQIKTFDELRNNLDNNTKGETALTDTLNDIKKEINSKVEAIFGKSSVFQTSWIRFRNTYHSRTYVTRVDNNINDKTLREKITKLQDIIDKLIEVEHINENNQKQKKFYRNDTERLEGCFQGLDLFNDIIEKKIKVSINKNLLHWFFNYEISVNNNHPRLALDVTVQTFNQISFGNTKNILPKRMISYKEARTEFTQKIVDDLKAMLRNNANQAPIKIVQGQTR